MNAHLRPTIDELLTLGADLPLGTIGIGEDSNEVLVWDGKGNIRRLGEAGETLPGSDTFAALQEVPTIQSGDEGLVWGVTDQGTWGLIAVESSGQGGGPGSGITTLSQNAILVGNSSGVPSELALGGASQVLISAGNSLGYRQLILRDISGWPLAPTTGQAIRFGAGGTVEGFDAVQNFSQLLDTPATFAGSGGYDVRVNSAGTGIEFVAPTAALIARGTWDASTGNAPTGTPSGGDLYTVSSAGTFAGTAYGTDDSIYYADGSWHKIEGGAGLQGGASTVVGATDTQNTTPSLGFGMVWAADALGAGVPGFAYQPFISATVNDYTAGRVLVTDGTQMVDQPFNPVPGGTAEGQLAVWNASSSAYALLNRGAQNQILTSTDTGLAYQNLSTLFAQSGISSGIGSSDQIVSGPRSLDLNGFNLSYLYSGTGSEALATTWNSGTLALVMSARDASNNTTLTELSPAGFRLRFIGDAGLELWDDSAGAFSRGQAGMSIVSAGPSAPPKYGYPAPYVFDTNGDAYEIVVDTSGNLSTSAVNPPTAQWSLTPNTVFAVSGTEGQQDFGPASIIYTLSNDGTDPINWTAASSDAWAVVSPASGTLAAGGTQAVTVSADQAVLDDLAVGTQPATITFDGTSVPDLTRSATATVNSATTNRVAVFPDDISQFAELNWAPTGQDFTVRFSAAFTGTDDAAIFGGDIYANFGALRKGSGEIQFWINGNAQSSSGMALAASATRVEIEIRHAANVTSFWRNGVEISQTPQSSTIPTVDFQMFLGKVGVGTSKPMEGTIDYFELIDPLDSTNNVLYTMNSDDFANTAAGSVRPAGVNNGPVTFADA